MSNVCNKNPETTVLAHLNMRGVFRCGMSQKPPDWAGAWSCSACHDLLDGRVSSNSYTAMEIENLHQEGIRLNFVGKIEDLPKKLRQEMADSEAYTQNNTTIDLNIAVNYGAREELVKLLFYHGVDPWRRDEVWSSFIWFGRIFSVHETRLY